MTTTSDFQKKPDFYLSKEECEKNKYKAIQTNPRYKHFIQTHFTAGDEEQFQQYKYSKNNYKKYSVNETTDNLFNLDLKNQEIWGKYMNVDANTCIDTFRYIFYKFKKGIFVKIVNNNLKVFLPFSNVNFSNEWGNRIKIEPKYRDFYAFFKYISSQTGYKFYPNTVIKNESNWYANNCLIRYDKTYVKLKNIRGFFPTEGDSNTNVIKNMMENLCENRKIPDMEFFINRRDFPILTKDSTEPYNNIWDSKRQKLVSHDYDKYLPIFSMCGSERYADIVMPTWEDWARVQNKENIWFPKSCKDYDIDFDVEWKDKKPTAVFRGASTGCGVDIKTNPRLNIAHLSSITKPDENGIRYLDAGITKWNLRARKIEKEKYLKTINTSSLPFGLSDTMSPYEQSSYKYIVNIDGHVSAFRLSLELNMGSVILLVDSDWELWYKKMLKPYEHYVPVKRDLSDIVDQIKWCRKNDDKCEIIAKNAKDFHNKYLLKDGILDFMQQRMVNLKKQMGAYLYNYISPLDLNIIREYKSFVRNYPPTTKNISDISIIPSVDRCYGLLKGLEWVVNMLLEKNEFENVCVLENQIFKNKLGSVRKFNLNNYSFAVKTTRDKQKIKEHIHETYVGLNCTNKLSKYIPNFVYIFGLYEKEDSYNVITEYIEGQTLFEWINDKTEFKFDKFCFILIQLSLAVQVAQNNYGFVHYDLTPWNIIMKKLETPIEINYVISHDKVICIKTDLIPVIIDYGKTHVIYENEHHGFINMFKTSSVQDILTLLTKTLDQIITAYRLPKDDFTKMFSLTKFITGTKYQKDDLKNAMELRRFLEKTRKYTYLIRSEKYELEEKTPLDFATYINNRVLKKTKLKQIGFYRNLSSGNEKQIFDYILSKTLEERKGTFINYFNIVKKCSLSKSSNLFYVYFKTQKIESDVLSVKNHMDYFLTEHDLRSKEYDILVEEVMNNIRDNFTSEISKFEPENIDIKKIKLDEKIFYDEETFLNPSKISILLDKIGNLKNEEDSINYKNMVETTLLNSGSFQFSEKHKIFYTKNFRDLLNNDSLLIKSSLADKKSLIEITKILYSINLTILQKKSKKNKKDFEILFKILNKLK
jgi:hypothetical protein